MAIYRSAAEIAQLKRKIRDYISWYIPEIKIYYKPFKEGPFVVGEFTARTRITHNEITFDERMLVSWPEEEIWKTVNHELAHIMTEPEYKQMYPASFPNLSADIWHSEPWEKLRQVLGGRGRYHSYPEYPKRFKLTCATCGMMFYTNGPDLYWEEPKGHPLTHRFFCVEDVITRKRAKIPRTRDIRRHLFGIE